MERLRSQLNLKDNASLSQAFSDVERAIATPDELQAPIKTDEFLAFRKDILNRIRHLEDEIAELQLKTKR